MALLIERTQLNIVKSKEQINKLQRKEVILKYKADQKEDLLTKQTKILIKVKKVSIKWDQLKLILQVNHF